MRKTGNTAYLPPENPFSQLRQNTAVEIASQTSESGTVLVRSVVAAFAGTESTTEVKLSDLRR